jgi:3-hydroxy-9,10-secoandrosta-1,3,5(10)-triene-9,17-dione monooxygenase reductase component
VDVRLRGLVEGAGVAHRALDRVSAIDNDNTALYSTVMEHVDIGHFRRVLSSYPTGVVVVCADSRQGPVGMSCNSFTAVSLSPPLIAVCPADTSTTWPSIREAGRFCVSVLASEAEEICARFARKDTDRFAGIDVRPRSHGPAISNAVAWIDCELYDEFQAGDHTIALGRVVALERCEKATPLVFWASGYGTVARSPDRTPESLRLS